MAPDHSERCLSSVMSFPPLSQEMCKQGPCACSGLSLLGRVPACTPHLQGHSTFPTYQVQGGGEPLAAAPEASPGAHNPGLPSNLVSLSLGLEQPRHLILWETSARLSDRTLSTFPNKKTESLVWAAPSEKALHSAKTRLLSLSRTVQAAAARTSKPWSWPQP